MKPFKTLQIDEPILNRVQDNVRLALNPVLALPISDGVLIEDVELTSGQANYIAHKLQRKPRLWMLAKQTANAVVWENTANTKDLDLFLDLRCSANCTVHLWVA